MQEAVLRYGHGAWQRAALPDDWSVVTLEPREFEAVSNPKAEVMRALHHPIGAGLESLKGARSVAIAISDPTRPSPSRLLLECLLDELATVQLGLPEITVLVGSGLHPPISAEEAAALIGENLAGQVRLVVHDARAVEDLIYLGESSRGTPIWVNRHFLAADKRIVTGMIDPHQFMGFTAGAKGAVIGLGGAETIRANHRLMFQPGAFLGNMGGNPAREDVDEIGGCIGIDMILNVVLNRDKQMVRAVCGDPIRAHREGVGLVRELVQVPTDANADLVIASAGGYPKDINVYQAQKALVAAGLAVRQDGWIILVAECQEGFGEDLFREALQGRSSPKQVAEEFVAGEFRMGPHKAYLWARTLARAHVVMVSDALSAADAVTLMVDLAPSLEEAVQRVAGKIGPAPRVILMPAAPSMVPIVSQTVRLRR